MTVKEACYNRKIASFARENCMYWIRSGHEISREKKKWEVTFWDSSTDILESESNSYRQEGKTDLDTGEMYPEDK